MIKPLSHFFLINTCALVQKGDKFLIAQRGLKDRFKPGEWSLPGGKLEWELKDGHVLEDNLKRELREEVGIEIEENMILLNNHTYQAKKFQVLRIVFWCQWESGKALALEDTEAVKWESLEELEENSELPEWIRKELVILKDFSQKLKFNVKA